MISYPTPSDYQFPIFVTRQEIRFMVQAARVLICKGDAARKLCRPSPYGSLAVLYMLFTNLFLFIYLGMIDICGMKCVLTQTGRGQHLLNRYP